MVIQEKFTDTIRKGINNIVGTYRYLSGDSKTRYNYKYTAKRSEVNDTLFKDFASKVSHKARIDPDNGMIQVVFDVDNAPIELAELINPKGKATLYKYVTDYKDGTVTMEFPMMSVQKEKSNKGRNTDRGNGLNNAGEDRRATLNGKPLTGNESVMVPTPISYGSKDDGIDRDYKNTTMSDSLRLLDVSYNKDGEVKINSKYPSLMRDVKTESLELSEPEVNNSLLTIDINGKTYKYKVKDSSDKTTDDVARTVSKMKKYSNGKALAYLKKNMDLVKESKDLEESMIVSSGFDGSELDSIKVDIYNAVKDFMIDRQGFVDDDDVDDYAVVKVYDVDNDTIYVDVSADIDYDTMLDLQTILDDLIVKYDRETYFDNVEPGVIRAVIDRSNLNPSLFEVVGEESEDFEKKQLQEDDNNEKDQLDNDDDKDEKKEKSADGEKSFEDLVDKLHKVSNYSSFVNSLKGLNENQKKLFMKYFGKVDIIKPDTGTTDIPATQLKPTQSEIDWKKSLSYGLGQDVSYFFDSSVELGIPVLTYKGKYIIDGHHRWSQVFMFNPKTNVKCINFDYSQSGPIEVLKDFQSAVLAQTGEIKVGKAGTNIWDVDKETLIDYITSNISDACWKSLVKNKVAKDKKSAVEYIVKNAMLLQSKVKPISGAPDRVDMPQTDPSVIKRAAKAITDMSESLNISEGNSFKDHHICQGCGKPLSQCTCNIESESLEEDATQLSNIGQHKVDSIDLVESQSGDTVDYKDWDGEIVKDLTINTKDGHKLTIKDFKVYFHPFEESDINMKVDYDYETSDGRKGSSSCDQVSLWRMIHGKRY